MGAMAASRGWPESKLRVRAQLGLPSPQEDLPHGAPEVHAP